MFVHEQNAIDELSDLSLNAKLWLEDRIGNRLQAIQGFADLGNPHRIDHAVSGLVADMKRIGIFERQK